MQRIGRQSLSGLWAALVMLSLVGCEAVLQPSGSSTAVENGVATVGTASVSSSSALVTALANASPGDVIELAPGTYTTTPTSVNIDNGIGGTVTRSWFFLGSANGTSSSPITLRSVDPANPAILEGDGWNAGGYALYITGDYWIVEDIVVRGAAKGVMLDNSNHTRIQGVEIYDIGQEGLHVRDGSSDVIIDGINLHDVGKLNDGFGEGVYIGSDNSVWAEGDGTNTGEKGLLYSREVHNTIIRNSTIGPNITAEPFDIKEGTTGTVVENNVIYGSGVSGNNYADSHIDIKGSWAVVRYNTFYQSGNANIARAVMIVPRQSAGVDAQYTAHDNYIHDNTFHLESSVELVVANSGSADIYAWDNTKVPNTGSFYNSRVIQSIPPGYDPGTNPNPNPDPDPNPDPGTGELKLQYDNAETDASSKSIKPDVLIVNTGSSTVTSFSIRYYFTDDGLSPTFSKRYYESGTVSHTFGFDGQDYVQLDWSGSLAPGADVKLKFTIGNAAYQFYDQTDDHSFDAGITSFTDYANIPVYLGGALVWGVEP